MADDKPVPLLSRVLERGRSEVLRAADEGRTLLRVQALERELAAFRMRLGKTAYRLHEEGEIDHPAVAKAATRIRELEAEIAHLRGGPPTDAG